MSMIGMVSLLMVAAAPLYTLDDAGIDAYIHHLHMQEPEFGVRLAQVVCAAEGTPYADSPLGEGPGAPVDADPLVDFGRVDCVTFVEQSIALAGASSHREAVDLLQRIRYEDGVIDFGRRNHFMVADWICHNPFCADITDTLGVPVVALTRTIDRKAFFERAKAPELGADIVPQTMTLQYVAVADATAVEPNLPSPALIVFIGKLDWLFALHCGIYLREPDGSGRVVHASSTSGKVVRTPLDAFFEGSTRYLGFTVYAISDPVEKGVE